MDFVSPITDLISKYVIDPALLPIKYLKNAEKNVEDMGGELAKLIAVRKDVQQAIAEATRTGEMNITNVAEQWILQVKNADSKAKEIKNKYDQRGCLVCGNYSLTFWTIYNISKSAETHIQALNKLEKERPQDLVAPAPPRPIYHTPTSVNVIGMTSYIRKIYNYLEDDKVGIIGIRGMGGVGKTTLLEKINNDLDNNRKNLLFDYVITVVVSKEFNKEKLQNNIVKRLKLESASPRNDAERIFDFLKDKNFLVLLDDIWEAIDPMKDLGIPNPLEKVVDNTRKRKIVITTRSNEVCSRMGATDVYIECLNFEDAWTLFKEVVKEDTFSSDLEIKDLAEQVAKVCGGLPLALKVIGGGMAGKKNVEVWRYCLYSLQNSLAGTNIIDLTSLFRVLKFSYDQLRNDTLQKCFLSCSLWPEDYNISKDELVTCWLGLGLMDDMTNMQEVYGQGEYFLTILKESCLLQPRKNDDAKLGDNDYVKMHDVIRDLALWIANGCEKKEKKWIVRTGVARMNSLEMESWSSAERVSLMRSDMDDLPSGLPCCPKLAILILRGCRINRIPEAYFQNFTSLTYLDLSHNYRLEKLPSRIDLLSHLKYLDLSYMGIESLPKGMEKLVKLEYLFLHETRATVTEELEWSRACFMLHEPTKFGYQWMQV